MAIVENQSQLLKRILVLAIPVSLQALITSSLSFVDIYMVSSLGADNVAAVGLINKVYFVFIVTLFGLGSGVSVLVAQYWGSDKKHDVHALLSAGLAWTTIVTIPLALIGYFLSPLLGSWLTPDPTIQMLTVNYWQWTSPFIFFTGISLILATIQRATDDTFWPMVASVIALVSNTALNYLVLFGPFEILNTGMKGVAMATNLSRLFEVFLLIYVLYRHLKPKWVWKKSTFLKIWNYGKVLTFQEALWSGGLFSFFIIYSYMGANELAAMSLLSPIESIFIDIFLGFGVATSILLGQHLGRNEFEEAWRLQHFVLTRFTLAAAVFGVIAALLGSQIMSLFSSVDEPVQGLMYGVWLVYCFTIPIKTHNMIAVIGILRSGGDNPFVLKVEFISIWVLALPTLAIAGVVLGLPLWLVVLITGVEEAGKVFIFRWRIRQRHWLKNLTDH
jgi:putative MATE family efflux protein